jgi:hypothetical protein
MTNSNVVSFAGANLPAVKTLATSLRNIEADVGASGIVILKMDKTGCWCFGADAQEAQEGSKWAVNPFSFLHGHIAWGDGEVLGERMTGIANPLPELTEAPPGAKKGWEVQIGFSMKCTNGDDAGMEARFTTTAVGGKRSVQALAVAIAEQVERDQTRPVPLVLLETDHYQHKAYGKIFTPVFKVVEWIGMDGAKPAEQVESPKQVEAPPIPSSIRRPPVADAAPAAAAAAAPAAAAEAPGRRRRRPAVA